MMLSPVAADHQTGIVAGARGPAQAGETVLKIGKQLIRCA
jgi:hypothetical protein